jgi:hypothetical protein
MDEETLASLTNEIATALAPIVRKLLDEKVNDALALVFGQRSPAARATSKRAAKLPKRVKEARTVKPPRAVKVATPKRGEISLDAIKAALQGQPMGLRTEKLRMTMGLPDSARRRLALVLRKAVVDGELSRKGQKRATTYSLKK